MYNCAVLFAEPDNRAFATLSKMLNQMVKSDFVLEGESLPHLTLVQFEATVDQATHWRDDLAALMRAPLSLDLMGLTFLPGKDGNSWIEIPALKTERLLQLQRAVLATVEGARIHSATADSYRPHITLAHAVGVDRSLSVPLDLTVVRRKPEVSQISLGVSGAQFQFEQFRADGLTK